MDSKKADVVEVLLVEGALLGITDYWQNTPMHYASYDHMSQESVRTDVRQSMTIMDESDAKRPNFCGVTLCQAPADLPNYKFTAAN